MSWDIGASFHGSKQVEPTVPPEGELGELLNVAAVCTYTRVLGPGARAVVWVQGCAFRCPGCIAPHWIPLKPARLVRPEQLINEVLSHPEVQGLTFSGGEPMLQAPGLARLARLAKSRRDIDIICYTGFSLESLLDTPPGPGVTELLNQVDVLIDGPYIDRLNDNRGLRGSSNQRIHFLTNRFAGYDFVNSRRKADIQLSQGDIMLVGVPPKGLGDAFHHAVDQAANLQGRLLQYERV